MSDRPTPEPCGSIRVLRRWEDLEQATVWCERTDGPCPWPGTDESKDSAHPCGTSGTRRFSVSWAPSLVEQAHARITSAHEAVANGGRHEAFDEQTLAVARDALAACQSKEAKRA